MNPLRWLRKKPKWQEVDFWTEDIGLEYYIRYCYRLRNPATGEIKTVKRVALI